jgi:hypothetical protein
VLNDATFKFFTEEQPAMAEAADAEAMRKQMAEMKKELEMMRRIIQIQNSQVQVNWILYIQSEKNY